jgi:hypothetical protein
MGATGGSLQSNLQPTRSRCPSQAVENQARRARQFLRRCGGDFALKDPGIGDLRQTTGRLLQACVEATRCEHFGLLAGQGLNLQSFGIIGRLMQTALSLHFALWDLTLTQARDADGAVWYLQLQSNSMAESSQLTCTV